MHIAATAVYTQLTTVAVLKNAGSNQMDIVSTVTGKVFVAKSPEIFGYDADGNLTNDGRFAYSWDAENRLVNVETAVSAVGAGAPKQKLVFGYDHQSRRVSKVVSNWTGSAWVCANELKFVYDGWNLLAILDAQSSILQSFVWGLDLSGTEQGAGGIGGLLFLRAPRPLGEGSGEGAYACAFDGNGNVSALLDMRTGQVAAEYEYSPFGELIRATGPLAKKNPFRFSTKYRDDETGLLYYGYRYYQPSTGRWPSRDPIGEEGGWNVYAAFFNCPTRFVDRNGRDNYGQDGENVLPVEGTTSLASVDGSDPVGFALCMRDVNAEGLVEKILLIGFKILHPKTPTEHAYLQYKPCDNCEKAGWGIGGTKPGAKPIPETKFGASDCKPCMRTGVKLQFGSTTKTGDQATDSEILDCITKVPTSKNYKPTGKGKYNCLDWAKEAASKCGLECN